MNDRNINQFDNRLLDQVRRKFENYFIYRLDLTTAQTDHEISLAGEYLYIMAASSNTANAQARLNRNTNHALDLIEGIELETVFERVFITNTAQADEWLDILVGCNFKYKKQTVYKISAMVSRAIPAKAHTNHEYQSCNRGTDQRPLHHPTQ